MMLRSKGGLSLSLGRAQQGDHHRMHQTRSAKLNHIRFVNLNRHKSLAWFSVVLQQHVTHAAMSGLSTKNIEFTVSVLMLQKNPAK